MNWNFHSKGGIDAVKSAAAADKKLPKSAKDYIGALLADPPADALGCRVDGYCQEIPQPNDLKLTHNIQITIAWTKP